MSKMFILKQERRQKNTFVFKFASAGVNKSNTQSKQIFLFIFSDVCLSAILAQISHIILLFLSLSLYLKHFLLFSQPLARNVFQEERGRESAWLRERESVCVCE